MRASEPNLRSRLWGWFWLLMAFAVAGNVIWESVRQLAIPLCVMAVLGFVVVQGLRYWRSRHFW